MTLDDFRALDPLALWRALPPERQASIIVPLLTSAFSEVVMEDDGTDASWHDREAAAVIHHDTFNTAWHAIEAAFPEILSDDPTALWTLRGADLAAAVDDAETVEVHGLPGRHSAFKPDGAALDHFRQVSLGGELHDIDGWRDIAVPGEPPRWVAWTRAQVDAERLRRHPEQPSRTNRSTVMLRKAEILRDIADGNLPGIERAFCILVNWIVGDAIEGLDSTEDALTLLLEAAEALDYFDDNRAMPDDVNDTLRKMRRGRSASASGGTFKAGGAFVPQHLEWWRPVFARTFSGEA